MAPTTFRPFSTTDWLHGTVTVFRLSVAPVLLLGVIGWIVRLRRGQTRGLDAALCTVGVYFLETLLYPFTNERRIVLVLPVALAWFAYGIWTLGQLLVAAANRLRPRDYRQPMRTGAAVVAVAVALPLIWQFPRNYMLPIGRSSSAPGSSPSIALLRQLGTPADLVETDYVWATSLFTGHRASNSFFESCSDEEALASARKDSAVYLLTSGFAVMGIGSPCGIEIASRTPSAVRLYPHDAELDRSLRLRRPRHRTPRPK